MPLTLMNNWEQEFARWAPDVSVDKFHGDVSQRKKDLLRVQRNGGVLLITYTLVTSCLDLLSEYQGCPFTWDYLILDEGLSVKNSSKRTISVNSIPSRNRIILIGAPMENKLMELWSIFNVAHHWTLLRGSGTFKDKFDRPIMKARKKDSTALEKRIGHEILNRLRTIIEPYFLRRTKF